MKRYFALILAGLMVAGLSSSVVAQRTQGGPQGQQGQQRGGGRIDPKAIEAVQTRVINSLGLTATQKNQVAAAQKKQRAAMDALNKKYPREKMQSMSEADRKKRQDESTKIRNTHEAEMKKAMGAKYATYQTKLQAEMQKEFGAMMGGMARVNVEAIHTRVINGLGLTAAQKNQVAAAQKKFQTDMTAVSKLMNGKSFRDLSEAERKKYSDGMKKANDTRTASMKKAMGAKYATYEKKMAEEIRKEMEKANPGGRGGANPPRPGGRGGA